MKYAWTGAATRVDYQERDERALRSDFTARHVMFTYQYHVDGLCPFRDDLGKKEQDWASFQISELPKWGDFAHGLSKIANIDPVCGCETYGGLQATGPITGGQ